MKYRKAISNDINYIAQLVTDLLGTCNIESEKPILESNIEEISKTIAELESKSAQLDKELSIYFKKLGLEE